MHLSEYVLKKKKRVLKYLNECEEEASADKNHITDVDVWSHLEYPNYEEGFRVIRDNINRIYDLTNYSEEDFIRLQKFEIAHLAYSIDEYIAPSDSILNQKNENGESYNLPGITLKQAAKEQLLKEVTRIFLDFIYFYPILLGESEINASFLQFIKSSRKYLEHPPWDKENMKSLWKAERLQSILDLDSSINFDLIGHMLLDEMSHFEQERYYLINLGYSDMYFESFANITMQLVNLLMMAGVQDYEFIISWQMFMEWYRDPENYKRWLPMHEFIKDGGKEMDVSIEPVFGRLTDEALRTAVKIDGPSKDTIDTEKLYDVLGRLTKHDDTDEPEKTIVKDDMISINRLETIIDFVRLFMVPDEILEADVERIKRFTPAQTQRLYRIIHSIVNTDI